MHLTLQQLKLFQSVFRNGSYTKAAAELHLTQPAISIQLKRLEEQAGIPLFEQVGKKIVPTRAGKIVYDASLDILGRVTKLSNSIESLKGVARGPINVSVVTTAKYFMPYLLGQFLKEYPEVEPKLKFTNRATVVQRLTDNEDDFVVMGQIPPDAKLEARPFLENIIVPVAPPDHPLVGQKNIPLKKLIKERFLVREPGSGTRLVFENMVANHDLKIEPYMELGSAEAIKQGVMAGLGLAALSLHSLRLEIASNKMAVLDVEGFPIKRRWFVAYVQGKQLSLTAQTFLDYILEQGAEVLRCKQYDKDNTPV